MVYLIRLFPCFIGALSIKWAIKDYKNGDYFWTGMWVICAIVQAIDIAKLAFNG